MRAEEWLGETNRMLEVFLGPEAGEAVRDDCLRGLPRFQSVLPFGEGFVEVADFLIKQRLTI